MGVKMDNDKSEIYANRAIEDRELARQLDLKYFQDSLEAMPGEERDKKIVVIGAIEYSLQDIYDEIHKEAENAEMFRSLLRSVRLARSGEIKR